MEINSKLTQLLNYRSEDLKVEIEFLRLLKKLKTQEVPSATKTINELESKLKEQLNVKDNKNIIEALNFAHQKTKRKMTVFLQMDLNAKTLADLGAKKTVITGLNDLKESIKTDLFSVYKITDTDLEEIAKEIPNE